MVRPAEKKKIYILLYFIKKVLNKVQMLQEKKEEMQTQWRAAHFVLSTLSRLF